MDFCLLRNGNFNISTKAAIIIIIIVVVVIINTFGL